MKRGLINEQELRERIAYIHGRVERELEAFANSLAIPAVELTQRLGRLLLGEGSGFEDSLPHVRLETRSQSQRVAKVESPVDPHGSRPRLEAGGREAAPEVAPGEVKEPSPIKKYWAQFTPEERRKMFKARQRKWAPEAKAKWRNLELPPKKAPSKKVT
jgi:hypothetical protein